MNFQHDCFSDADERLHVDLNDSKGNTGELGK